ncbi:iron-sulfur cluster assembly 2 homolog, mitochondrial [Sitodiplosis mosellana]|uniref:iron-sulfur cluster assembly 2 homolog, mitochondrial n=1 Tax=Sitodiplosis mosellana TaxID=263140 RepID=UPI0024448AAA|nr:iron-sulfur cluster assembly 2 homolog, mitochondrial [Sitodiplosis mosellana]
MKRAFQQFVVAAAPRLRNTRCGRTDSQFYRTFASQSAVESSTSNQPKNDKPKLILSEMCIKKLKEISERESKKYLRVTVDGGGCSGFQYKFDLDDKVKEDDVVFGDGNSQVVIDTLSLDYCDGATVDYHTELIKSGFRILNNPKAEQGCSCGASFSIKF